MATKHHDSKRTDRSHDKAAALRVSRRMKNLDQHLADRAFRRLMLEVNGR